MAQELVQNTKEQEGSTADSLIEAAKKARQNTIDNEKRSSASTFTAYVIDDDKNLQAAHVGDGRIYVISDGEVELITPIQNPRTKFIESSMQQGRTRSEAKQDLKQRIEDLAIARTRKPVQVYLPGETDKLDEVMEEIEKEKYPNLPKQISNDPETPMPEITIISRKLKPGDEVMSFTDGLVSGFDTLEDMYKAMKKCHESENPAEYLIEMAMKKLGRKSWDDISATYTRAGQSN